MIFRLAILLACALGAAAVFAQQTGNSSSPVAPGGPSLKTTLETGLKARRAVEFSFIKKVTTRVDDGTLPKSLVESTFLWARKKRPHPYPYFERGLKERAQKLGITL